MLPSVINSLEDAAEGDRQHYAVCMKVGSKNHGKFTLQLDGKHPVQVKNAELVTEVNKIPDLKTRLEAKAIPEGKIAADPNVVELGEAVVGLGLKSKKDISDLKTRAETAEGKLQKEETDKLNRRVAAAAGKNAEAWAEHVAAKGLQFLETTVKDDKGNDAAAITVVSKGENGAEIQTPLKDYVEKTAVYVAPAEKSKRKFGVPKEEGEPHDSNEFDEIRSEEKGKQTNKNVSNVSFASKFFGHGSAPSEG